MSDLPGPLHPWITDESAKVVLVVWWRNVVGIRYVVQLRSMLGASMVCDAEPLVDGGRDEDTDEGVHFVQSEAVQAFRFQAVHGSEVEVAHLSAALRVGDGWWLR